jgi:hypothetical protein
MSAGFGICVYGDRACPKFFRANACKVDGGFSVHAWRRGHIAIQLVAWHNSNAVVFPRLGIGGFFMNVCA